MAESLPTPEAEDLARSVIDAAARGFVHGLGQRLESERLPPDDHRPWPAPRTPWLMAQVWDDLLFAHWAVRASDLRPFVPPALPVDTFDGSAWLAVTPFSVRGLRMRGLPAVPGISTFREINVRTYVTIDGKPGVFFFSLDADTLLGVQVARLWFRLPYFYASCKHDRADAFRFRSVRSHPDAPAAEFDGGYQPIGRPEAPTPGSLEWWLTERYCFYVAFGDGRVERVEIHHAPWPLQRAEAELHTNTMALPLDMRLARQPTTLHYARTLDVSIWGPEVIEERRRCGTRAA
ncbi:MAG: DUF2071 domain-containing protein [Candidatus Rokubacteria bacterium]|nr:DUF2071 domain-containing protein [Candidatus Rokubacteria bacterium]